MVELEVIVKIVCSHRTTKIGISNTIYSNIVIVQIQFPRQCRITGEKAAGSKVACLPSPRSSWLNLYRVVLRPHERFPKPSSSWRRRISHRWLRRVGRRTGITTQPLLPNLHLPLVLRDGAATTAASLQTVIPDAPIYLVQLPYPRALDRRQDAGETQRDGHQRAGVVHRAKPQ